VEPRKSRGGHEGSKVAKKIFWFRHKKNAVFVTMNEKSQQMDVELMKFDLSTAPKLILQMRDLNYFAATGRLRNDS
jgi:hypothetical protein